jgi:hypothetical protein
VVIEVVCQQYGVVNVDCATAVQVSVSVPSPAACPCVEGTCQLDSIEDVNEAVVGILLLP